MKPILIIFQHNKLKLTIIKDQQLKINDKQIKTHDGLSIASAQDQQPKEQQHIKHLTSKLTQLLNISQQLYPNMHKQMS